MPTYS